MRMERSTVAAFERFCDRQIHEGATALIVCGTTGEGPTLSRAEHDQIVRMAVDVAHGRVPVIAAAGSNSTSQAIELAKDAEAAGADAVLSVVPYYNKPIQAGMYAHFRAIADSIWSSDYSLRRSVAHGLRPRRCHGRSLGRKSAIHRAHGCNRRHDATATIASPAGTGLSTAVWRRCDRSWVHCSRRRWLHFGDVERCTGSVPRLVPGVEAGPDQRGSAFGGRRYEIDVRAFRRNQSGAGQICAQSDEHHVAPCSLAPRRTGQWDQSRHGFCLGSRV